MSSIHILPIEVLEWVTKTLSTYEQMRLWLCGDSFLNRKLRNGGLRTTSLQWASVSCMPWPRYFFCLSVGLREVYWNTGSEISSCPTLDIHLLPSALQRLQICCENIFYLLRYQNVNFNEIFPCLQSLKLQGRNLSEENLKQLPSKLTELFVSSDCRISSNNLFRDLPRSIERLRFDFQVDDTGEHENDLPNNLKYLHISVALSKFNWFTKLPKSLKYLSSKTLGYADLTSLPSQLEELTATDIPRYQFHQLPQHATLLPGSFTSDLCDQSVRSLPKSLTRILKIPYRNFPPFRLPPLTCMEIYHINDDICAVLPLNLRSLKVEQGLISTVGVTKIPKSVSYLRAPFHIFDGNETMACLSFIANLSFYSEIDHQAAWANQQQIWDDWTEFLEPPRPPFPSTLDSLIPKNAFLQSCSKTPLRADWLNGLAPPPESEVFKILKLEIFESHTSPHRHFTADFFGSLSLFRYLTILYLFDPLGGIQCEHLRCIPKSVTKLSLSRLPRFPVVSELGALPICLKVLKLEIWSNQTCDWKDKDLNALPRSLKTLTIKSSSRTFPKLTVGVNKCLPPYLQALDAPFKDLVLRPLGHLWDHPQRTDLCSVS